MCRFACYLGNPLTLNSLLLAPPHSLSRQSWQPREMQTATMNADGYGFGWYHDGGCETYRHTYPIWADSNLPGLARSLSSRLWMAYVRSATDGYSTGLYNTQPFQHDDLLFLHNGFITGFVEQLRGKLRQWLSPAVEAGIHGNTDSEYLFAVIRELLAREPEADLVAVMRTFCRQLAAWLPKGHGLLNIALSRPGEIVAIRHALDDGCPSLYWTDAEPLLAGGKTLVSEPLTEQGRWQAVPAHHIIQFTAEHEPRIEAI